jgi:hypothetical protein
MKKIILIAVFLYSSSAFSQNYSFNSGSVYAPSPVAGIGYNLDRLVNNSMSNSDTYASRTYANGDYAYKTSLANINNQVAYSMYLNNDALKTSVYFEKKQMNLYNRTLLEFQKKEISRMRRYQNFSKEDLDDMFDVRYKTGFIMP